MGQARNRRASNMLNRDGDIKQRWPNLISQPTKLIGPFRVVVNQTKKSYSLDLSGDLSGNARRKFFACLPRAALAGTARLISRDTPCVGTTRPPVSENPARLIVDIELVASLVLNTMVTSPFVKPLAGRVKLT